MLKPFSLKPITVVLSFLAVTLTLSGCGGIMSGSHAKVTYKPGLDQSFSKRSQLPQISSESAKQLKDTGYVQIGTLNIEHETKECWEYESSCNVYNHDGTSTDQFLKEAMGRGADVVTLSNNDSRSSRSTFKNGECTVTENRCSSVSVPTYQTHCSPRVGGSVSCSQRQSGTTMQTVCNDVCTSYKIIHGKMYTQDSYGALWRKDSQLSDKMNPNWELFAAIDQGDLTKVRGLLDRGAKPSARDKDGTIPLLRAVQADKIEVARELIARGADVTATDKYGETALHTAAEKGHLNIVKELTTRGADVNAQEKKQGFTPLQLAGGAGHLDVVKKLIADGANLDIKNKRGYTALHATAAMGHLNIVKELIARGADINAQDRDGATPLHLEAMVGHLNIVKELITRGADINAKTNGDYTALYLATVGGHLDIVKELIVHGADVNAKDKNGRTALNMAKEKGDKKIIDTLKKHGAE